LGKDTLVAIAFARARPIPLTDKDGATREFAYVGRTIMTDPREDIPRFDYSYLRRDLAHVEVVLPAHAPRAYLAPAVLAFALDTAELRKVRTPLWKRERLPQVLMSVIMALPPEFETSLHEASVIARRILVSASRSHPVPIHIAIHQAPINRHGHGDISFRSINPDGTFGLKIPDLFARFRTHGAEASVVEGTGWPDLAWETQQSFFLERGIELVVDPFAPAPERHLDIEIPDELTTQWVNNHRLEKRYANIRLIKGSPTHLIEILLRGRSTLRVLELHRLCARFIDNEEDRLAQVDRILIDQNVVTLADTTGAQKPRYVTTRRVARLINRAMEILDRAGNKLIAVTGPNHDAVVAQLSDKFASEIRRRDPPLILGRSLSDCDAIAEALAEHNPVVGTLDMVMGEPDKRARGRRRDVRMKAGRAIIVPHAELVEDRRLARLLLAVDRAGSKLFLGHDQSRETGIVCRYLAAHIADRPAAEPAIRRHAGQPREIERLLRSGLMRRAIEAMANLDILNFRSRPEIHIGDTAPLAVIDDPRRIEGISDAIRMNSVRAGAFEKHETLTGPRGEMKFSLGEWVVTTGRRGLPAALDAHQLARIVAIDATANWIDVFRRGDVTRLDFRCDPAIRPAAAITIRDAWDAPPDTAMVIELSDPGRVWSALLLAASRAGHQQLYIDPAIARTPAQLVVAARRSLPSAPPSHRVLRPDSDAMVRKILDDFDPFPEDVAIQPELTPPPAGFAEEVRQRVMRNGQTRLAYGLLHKHVATDNPDSGKNVQRLLGLCSSELTKSIILHLAELDDVPGFDEFDLPLELVELEPRHWTPWELYKLEMDLKLMTIRAAGWKLLPPALPRGTPPRPVGARP
jgi:hypothetical protein